MDISTVEPALATYMRRKVRSVHPQGEFDKQGRWYPSESERQSCCAFVRSPSARWPYSLLTHCRSAEHVARLYGLDEEQTTALVRHTRTRPFARVPFVSDDFYKAVVVDAQGRYRSHYEMRNFPRDDDTVYALGVELVQRVRRDHGGGYYAYDSRAEAERQARKMVAGDPTFTVAVLRVRVAGQHSVYECGCWDCLDDGPHQLAHRKHAFSRITPLEVVMTITSAGLEEVA